MIITEYGGHEMKNEQINYPVPPPVKPADVVMAPLPEPPCRGDCEFRPQLNFSCRLFKSKLEKAEKEAEEAYKKAYTRWEETCNHILLHNGILRLAYKRGMDQYRNDVANWEVKKARHGKIVQAEKKDIFHFL